MIILGTLLKSEKFVCLRKQQQKWQLLPGPTNIIIKIYNVRDIATHFHT